MKTRSAQSIVLTAIGVVILLLAACSDKPTGSDGQPTDGFFVRPLSLSSTSLVFSSWAGSNPNPARFRVAVKVGETPTTIWTATTGTDWIRLGPEGTDTIVVSVISDTLPAGRYSGAVVVSVPGVPNSPLTISVSLAISNRLTVSENLLIFSAQTGGDNPEPQTFVVTDYENHDVTYQVTTSTSWLGLENTSGVVPGTVVVSPDISGLSAGQYMGEIVATSADLPGIHLSVDCQLNLSSWAEQDLGLGGYNTTVRLEGIQFDDNLVGWASGWSPWAVEDHMGRVLRTVDGGQTWDSVLNREGTRFGGLAVQDANRCWVVGDSSCVEYSSNGGTDWHTSDNLPLAGPIDLAQVVFLGFPDGWIVGKDGTIIHTVDNGQNWSLQTTPTDHDLSDVQFVDTLTGWAVGNHGTILHTADAGTTWTAQDAGSATDLRAVYFVDNLVGWAVGTSGMVIHTNNSGTTWTVVDIGTSRDLRGIYFPSATHGWVVGLNGEILHTRNGGTSWLTQVTGLDEILTCVYFHDNSVGWVAGTGGIILSTTSAGF